jgi:hypothetical protein
MNLVIVDGPTIKAGESLSDAADCSAGQMVRITIPQEYTEANMTFQVSSDGNGFNDLYTVDGDEVTITAQPDSTVVIHEHWTKSFNFVKIRSGTREHPVEQRVDCKLAIAVEAVAGSAAVSNPTKRMD